MHLTGPNDDELIARCIDTDELDTLLDRLEATHGAKRTDTRIVLAHPIQREAAPGHP